MSWGNLQREQMRHRMNIERRVRKMRRIWWDLCDDITPDNVFQWLSFILALIIVVFLFAVIFAQGAIAIGVLHV